MPVLVVNNGSSSLKLRCLDDEDALVATRDLPALATDELGRALDDFLSACPPVTAAGHRVVHGGARFTGPLLIDDDAESSLAALADLAPLHNPPSLAGIRALRELQPDLPQVACFDTSFHTTLPPKASTYAVPAEWRSAWGIRRFGFHGLSHSWASRRAGELLGRDDLRLVTAHLGSGASLAAVNGGRSVDTTMGFTPLDGLVMSTRSGALDPGVVTWVQQQQRLGAAQVEEALERRSGLLALAGTADLREVITAAQRGDGDARLAYDIYLHRLRQGVAAMAASLGGIDALVFTGGAGEASAPLRSDACVGLGFLGLAVDDDASEHGHGDRVVSPHEAPAVLVVVAREDIQIARHVRALLGWPAPPTGG